MIGDRVRRILAIGTVFALLAGTASCARSDLSLDQTPSTTTKSTTTTSSAPVVPSTEPTTTTVPVAPIAWSPCDGGECATVEVPVDHARPEGPTISLFVHRRPARVQRIGSLFVNFGGPGASAADLVDRFPFPGAVLDRFDIVGMDPRGVGRSSPLDCGIDPTALYAVDPTVEDPADAAALVDVSQRFVQDCNAVAGSLLGHLGTRDVARDMDLVRAAMGDQQLSFLGFSYGTAIGQAYADEFPQRVRAMVLDGVVDPAPSGVDMAVQQATAFEAALRNWAAACPSRRSCPFGTDAMAAVDAMLAAAEQGVPSSGGLRSLSPGEAALGLVYPLYDESLWPDLDRAVAAADAGDGAGMVALADDYTSLVQFPIYFAVSCLDSTWPRSTDELLARAKQAAATAPHVGEAIVDDYLRCALWPAPPEPLGAIDAPGAPPIVLVSTTGDPATPYANAVAVADRIAGSVVLTHEGEGHTVVFQGSACVDRTVMSYLVDGTVPAAGARC